ncbi:MAG: DUF1972 domain-containing protein [Victivallales bacterium]|jgi:hypothetical protein|nr:DUF1972 domain-containing protein [Victivallales bacterium]
MKKLAIIGTVGIPACYGGFESLAQQLAIKLCDKFDITVYCQKSAFKQHPAKIGKINLKYLPLNANGKESVFYDIYSIFDALRYADTLLILGVGGAPLFPLLRLFGCSKKIVINIDGVEHRRNKWSKIARVYLRFAESCAVRYADEVVADNQVIVDYVRHSYAKPCHLIEYGADNRELEW